MVYFVSCNNEYIKIGVAQNIEARIKELQCGNPYKLKLVASISSRSHNDYDIEKALHAYLYSYRANVGSDTNTEWFESNVVLNLLSEFKKDLLLLKKIVCNFVGDGYRKNPNPYTLKTYDADENESVGVFHCIDVTDIRENVKQLIDCLVYSFDAKEIRFSDRQYKIYCEKYNVNTVIFERFLEKTIADKFTYFEKRHRNFDKRKLIDLFKNNDNLELLIADLYDDQEGRN